MTDKRLRWEKPTGTKFICAYNQDGEYLGNLTLEQVGAHQHWCWYQEKDIRMSPGCLQEVRDKQKELFKDRGNKDV